VRDARKVAHMAFDRLWKEDHVKRTVAYRWLGHVLGIENPRRDCHIKHFDIERCKQVVGVCVDMLLKCRCKKGKWNLSLEQALYLNGCRSQYRYCAGTGDISNAIETSNMLLWERLGQEERRELLAIPHGDYHEPLRQLRDIGRNGHGRPTGQEPGQSGEGEARTGSQAG